jgi:hypothetical protein
MEVNSNWRGGKSKHLLYATYMDMIGRCHRPTHAAFANYGGRGITVCGRWRADFWAFVADMGERPKGLSIDRIDNDKGYSPDNCHWATAAQQRANRRAQRLPDECGNGHSYPPAEEIRRTRDGKRRCLQCERDHARHSRERRPKAERNKAKGPDSQALDAVIAAEYVRLGATYEAVQAIANARGVRTETIRLRIRRAGVEVLDGRTSASRTMPIKRPPRFTNDQRSEILRLRKAGMSQQRIADRFGATQSSIRRFLISESPTIQIEDAA